MDVIRRGVSFHEKLHKTVADHIFLSDDGTLTISGSGVVADEQEMQKYKENTKRLVIEEGITDIVGVGLWEFKKLKAVKQPQTVKAVREGVFSACHSLKEVDIGGAVVIGPKAFLGCHSLKK